MKAVWWVLLIPLALCAGFLAMNAAAGCYPWSPKTVEFKQGMTLCPGQSAVVPLDLGNIMRGNAIIDGDK